MCGVNKPISIVPIPRPASYTKLPLQTEGSVLQRQSQSVRFNIQKLFPSFRLSLAKSILNSSLKFYTRRRGC